MAKKKKTTAEKLKELTEQLEERYGRWQYILSHGTSDPYWPDGMNMNLVRNHCVHYHRLIKELCESHGLPLPEIYHKPMPPEMPMDFMATERVCRWQMRHAVNPKKIITHPVQLSLF